jgi:hypothetical protein
MARLSGKLTAKALGWDRVAIGAATKDKPASTRVKLGRFVGIATGLRQTINGETGEVQTGLKGQFRGISSLTAKEPKRNKAGEVQTDKDGAVIMVDTGKPITVTAGVCYLPGGIQEMVEGTLATAQDGDAKATVQFALDLYAIPATNKAGYSFDADNLVEAAEADPLDMLLTTAEAAEQAALPAPDAEEVEEKQEEPAS